MSSTRWYTEKDARVDSTLYNFNTVTKHILIDSSHRRSTDPSYNYKVYFGVRDESHAAERLKNVISINVCLLYTSEAADD